jgi:hypothetical protein
MKKSAARLQGVKSETALRTLLRDGMGIAARFAQHHGRAATAVLIWTLVLIFFAGCARFPFKSASTNPAPLDQSEGANGKNRLIPLLPERPILLLLHGATEDRMEMAALGRHWTETHNVILYSYNFHDRLDKIAAEFVTEMKQLRAREGHGEADSRNMTVVAYSYGATVFRKAVLLSDDDGLFYGASLIQLVPTAGGSFLARKMGNPILSSLVSRASKSSAAENPYGSIAEELWDDDGITKFSEVIDPSRVHTFLVEDDSHSLAQARNEEVRKRYLNGIGTNVVVIPKRIGITHENFVTHAAALQYLRKVLGPSLAEVSRVRENELGTNATPADANAAKR